MGIEVLLGLGIVKKVLDVIRYVAEGDVIQWREIILVVGSWGVGIGLVSLLGSSSTDIGIELVNWQDYVVAGIGLGSAAGVGVDFFNGSATVK